ncbi:MAG: ABC transporter ATP-binding protein [Thermodesulfobacteriota bacterium]|nr:ABC transporter ATP-binding protein [Thermodesulfobacteriota bacterium]
MLLRVDNIRIHYKKIEAIKGISLEVEEGTIVTLLGSNGAGKSTVLRAISGLKPPSSGKITFSGERIDHVLPQDIVRLGISHVPEGRGIFPDMTVAENLELGAYLRKDGSEISRDMEGVLGHFPVLQERHKQLAGSLSGGEQQMLVIGRALMARPGLLLLDEPSLGLSPIMAQEIASVIAEINADGVTLILVEQNAGLALKLAQKGYVLETGRVALEGEAEDLLKDERVKKAYLGG